jgi:hypothetical protein
MRKLTMLCVGLLLAGASYGRPGSPELECDEIKQKIRYIRSKMRSGYTRSQGEKMEADLRKLRALRKKAC